ncbi:outer dynein arm-docking complex subunit 3 isoform X1 [Amia ocellicauda]|uniref:outer dynein arm-docking complex subunit 3 isoform X1 n=1 Tax=Amia ocellicauda TaxID=2972642 RepID=UPI0034640BD9
MILQLQQQDEKQRPEPLPEEEIVYKERKQRKRIGNKKEEMNAQAELEEKEMKEKYNKSQLRLREKKKRLEAELKEMKDSEQAKRSSEQQMVEEAKAHLRAVEKQRYAFQENSQQVTRTLNAVTIGVKHLSNMLDHIKQPKSYVPDAPVPPSSEEDVHELLSQAVQKVLLMIEELKGRDLGDHQKKKKRTVARMTRKY